MNLLILRLLLSCPPNWVVMISYPSYSSPLGILGIVVVHVRVGEHLRGHVGREML